MAMSKRSHQPIPPEIFRDLKLFDPERPPAIGTIVCVLHQNMIATYLGLTIKGDGFRFKPLYTDISLRTADVMRLFPPKDVH